MSITYTKVHNRHDMIHKFCQFTLQTPRFQFHDTISIGFIEKGHCLAHVDSIRQLGPNTLVVIPAQYVHWCQPIDPLHWQYQMLFLEPILMQSVTHPMAIKLTTMQSQQLKNILHRLASGSQATQHVELNQLTTFLQHHTLNNVVDHTIPHQVDPRLTEAKSYIKTNYASSLSMPYLAHTVGMTQFHFTRLFKKYYHISPNKYLVNCRINHAQKQLLNANSQSMATIATQNGFYDESHFNKLFKQYTGITPKHYQTQLNVKVVNHQQND